MHLFPGSRCHRERAVDLALHEHAQRMHLHAPADLRPLCQLLEARMRVLGYSSLDIFAVKLALHEAATNAYRHGNHSDRGKIIRVRYLVTATEVLLEVEDQGRGFDPNQVSNPFTEDKLDRPRGRGLFMMRAYMTWVSFNGKGNQVTLCRQRTHS
jgi:serine/threonine-protein kinase RsbW